VVYTDALNNVYLSVRLGCHMSQVKTEWDVTRFSDRVKNARPRANGDSSVEDTRLAKFFVNPQFGDMDEPSTILDRHGRIMVWYLPHIFAPCRVVGICFSLNI